METGNKSKIEGDHNTIMQGIKNSIIHLGNVIKINKGNSGWVLVAIIALFLGYLAYDKYLDDKFRKLQVTEKQELSKSSEPEKLKKDTVFVGKKKEKPIILEEEKITFTFKTDSGGCKKETVWVGNKKFVTNEHGEIYIPQSIIVQKPTFKILNRTIPYTENTTINLSY